MSRVENIGFGLLELLLAVIMARESHVAHEILKGSALVISQNIEKSKEISDYLTGCHHLLGACLGESAIQEHLYLTVGERKGFHTLSLGIELGQSLYKSQQLVIGKPAQTDDWRGEVLISKLGIFGVRKAAFKSIVAEQPAPCVLKELRCSAEYYAEAFRLACRVSLNMARSFS